MKIRIGLTAALFLLAMLPSAQAQEDAETTIYMVGTEAYWANDTPLSLSFNPPSAADSATTCTGCVGPDPFSLTASWEVPVDLSMGSGTARGSGFVKSWNNGPAPGTTLEYKVSVDGVEIATGKATEDVLAGAIVEFAFDLTFTGGEISAGQTMSVEYLLYDDATGGYNPASYPREGSAHPWSITLPLSKPLPPAPAPVLEPQFEDVAATSLALDFSYPEAATQVWTYNWTNANPVGNLTVLADVAAGSVNFVMIDDFNDTLLDATLEATYEQNQTFEGFEGNWTVRVTFTDFVGNATMSVMPDLPPVIPNPLAGPPDQTFEGGNADDGSNDTPGVPLLLVLLGLAFVAMRRRA